MNVMIYFVTSSKRHNMEKHNNLESKCIEKINEENINNNIYINNIIIVFNRLSKIFIVVSIAII